ncbi:SpoIVB peptidase [Desulfotomaculum nigrificans]|uniref:SpoIVB peptidase n=1 Tax=Desulfotomaculum nigrificans TaxID=1565 RepID=UPI0001FAE643|nr:SpoIVB peptidase [Desulfotomaculum nigrificans]
MDYRKQKTPVLFLAILFLGLCFQLPLQTIAHLPVNQTVYVGEQVNFNLNMPKALAQNIKFNVEGLKAASFSAGDVTPVAATPGELEVQVKLFGVIPLKRMILSVVPEVKVIPGGQAIGVMVESQGVMVVGRSAIQDQRGVRHNPAAEAGVEIGDVLLKIDGREVETEQQVRDLVNEAGEQGKVLTLELRRKGSDKNYQIKVKPIFCNETKRYRIGMFVRDSTAGVGTMTFFDPKTKAYGALGHIISDIDTGQPINLARGKIIGAAIQGIRAGKRGEPGEKIGMFDHRGDIVGNITKNTNCGIYGQLQNTPHNFYSSEAIPVATAQQVKEGPAEIYTVLEGNKIEKFSIEILKINTNARADGKGLVIKITDPKLLQKTGGIIQGMSGSPIIQDNKLVGAVTHVFVNDPTRGYGVLAEWMLYDSGTFPKHLSDRNFKEFDARGTVACIHWQKFKF